MKVISAEVIKTMEDDCGYPLISKTKRVLGICQDSMAETYTGLEAIHKITDEDGETVSENGIRILVEDLPELPTPEAIKKALGVAFDHVAYSDFGSKKQSTAFFHSLCGGTVI